ncbi:MAG TPA: nicotinamide-nucleotide adenylyltransferase [Candidatus Thermoplasmatota archaeon]|nr:nicotinamide-nucleotide adenylyltransferase [Candidatus Thermoplasmatota archaeon]
MKALYIGRFQPFHNGHLSVLRLLSKEYAEVIIGLGSSQDHDSVENPFSETERVQMIKQSLDAEGIHNYRIVPIPDIHDPPRWVEHVKAIIPDFDVVIANNPFTRRLFVEKGYVVKGTPSFERTLYAGKEIRRRMLHDEPWETLVPASVQKIINDVKGVQRLKSIKNRTKKP